MKVIEMKSSLEKPNPHSVSVRMLYDIEHAQAGLGKMTNNSGVTSPHAV